MITIKMAHDLMGHVHNGYKKITIRDGWRDYQPGKCTIVDADDPTNTRVVNVHAVTLTTVPNVPIEKIYQDGFQSRTHMVEHMKNTHYPEFNYQSPVTIVEWE